MGKEKDSHYYNGPLKQLFKKEYRFYEEASKLILLPSKHTIVDFGCGVGGHYQHDYSNS